MARIFCLKPVIDLQSEVLILGTLPGEESNRRKEYYAHPRNLFWKIVYSFFEEPMDSDYDAKCRFLLRHRVALWDVLESGDRVRSSDNMIMNEAPNDLAKFLAEHKGIKGLLLNGTKAYHFFQKYNKALYDSFPNKMVPSTSPMRGKYVKPPEEKEALWKEALGWIGLNG